MPRPTRVTKYKSPDKVDKEQVFLKPEAIQPMFRLQKEMDKALERGEYWPCLNNPYFYTDYDNRGFDGIGGLRILTEQQCEELCYGCPLLKVCYDFAVANDERFGVWGGIDFTERRNQGDDLFPEYEEEY